ncbi:hypothetical protein [Oceanihabitans sediminis]|uniref:hypothetical protein n=1 Tax=Oceanihabitans sediminis TaxID=1812012 RepID=UPI003A8F2530
MSIGSIFFIVLIFITVIISVLLFFSENKKLRFSLEDIKVGLYFLIIFILSAIMIYNIAQGPDGQKQLQELNREMFDGRRY